MMKSSTAIRNAVILALGLAAAPTVAAAMTAEEVTKLVRAVDDRQRNKGDFQAVAFMEQKEKGKSDKVFEAAIYRRDADGKMILLFTKPQAEGGKGYLKIEDSLFFYDPKVGKWERRTERERIGGTAASRSDVDGSHYADDYTARFVKEEKLGAFTAAQVELTGKPGIDVSAPRLLLWIDRASGNLLKEQRFADSGKLLRTAFYPKWAKLRSEAKQADVYYPEEIRIFDEIEQGNQTLVVMRQVKLDPLEENMFTKAWLESKSR